MFYDFDELDKIDDIELMEKQRESQNFLSQAIFASLRMF